MEQLDERLKAQYASLSPQEQRVADFIVDHFVAAISRQNPAKAPVANFMLKDSPCVIGLKKNEPALKEKVNALIAQGIKDGTLNTLSQQWLKAPLPSDFAA
ncbi:TPA: transporter substrate-binding domain-containing protein [Klebsiella aerogenes]